MIKILVVEDHTMTRMGLCHALSLVEDFELSAEAVDGEQAVDLARKLKPDVILMDIGLPKIDGIKATEIIKNTLPNTKVLVFTSRDGEKDAIDAFAAGADGYLMKGADEIQLNTAIHAVSQGTAWIDPAIAKIVLRNIKPIATNSSERENKNPSQQLVNELTEREISVLKLMVEGYQNKAISQKMSISVSTVKSHIHNILQKLYCKSRAEATGLALKKGII